MTVKKDPVEQAKESLEAMLREQEEMLEADRIAQGLPEGEYRGIAVIEAEHHAAEVGEN